MNHFTDLKDFCCVLYHLVYLKQYYSKPCRHSLLIFFDANCLPNSCWSVRFILKIYSATKLYWNSCCSETSLCTFQTRVFHCKLIYYGILKQWQNSHLIYIASILQIVLCHLHALSDYLLYLYSLFRQFSYIIDSILLKHFRHLINIWHDVFYLIIPISLNKN